MGFELNQLVRIYIKELSGLIWSRKHKENLPVFQVYEDVITALYMKNGEGVEVFKPVREKIMGKEYLLSAPQEYWDILTFIDLGFKPDDWDELSFRNRARLLAARYVKNMIDLITSYYDEMEERKKKLGNAK